MSTITATLQDARKAHGRFARIKQALLSSPMHLCPERALLVTEFYKHHDNHAEPMIIRKAKALRYLLERKSAVIHPDELIAGNPGSRRKSAIMQPEMAGIFMLQELLWIGRRKTTPMVMSWPDRLRIIFRVLPFWLTRNLLVRAFRPRIGRLVRYAAEQLSATWYLINEVNGIGHFLPNYERMLRSGVKGYLADMEGKNADFHRAARIACGGIVAYAGRLSDEALRLASGEKDETRAEELREIARVCRKVPLEPAESFHEAVQSLWLTHMAVCLEGLNSAVSFGRVDQYLYPYYRKDLERGIITPERAKEILLSFTAKTTEHVFLLNETGSRYHGGYLVAQAAIVGGTDREGNDAVNPLTYLFLDVMEEAGLREPNYQVRVHKNSPPELVRRAVEVARGGNGMPALFGDEAAVASLVRHGYREDEARDYGVVGCVELAFPGRSFFSTDAALFNLPACLILALNRGRMPGRGKQVGAPTPSPSSFASMDDVTEAFIAQVRHMVGRFVDDIQVIERGNRLYHPTPFSSMLVDGCIESGLDVTAGGARYNSSGVQGVGVADTADSLAAIEEAVFRRKKYTLEQVASAMRGNYEGNEELRQVLLNAPKFGNDLALPDGHAGKVMAIFHDALAAHRNTRGGPYVPGFYSSTTHVGFGLRTGALPSGRKAHTPFAASLSPAGGMDRSGPTAMLNSVAHADATLSPNGYALNLWFEPRAVEGEKGLSLLESLARGFFGSGGMEMQLNVVDAERLEDARAHPGRYPGLVVRVAGYCAYFDDLPDEVKGEIIARTQFRN